MQFMPPCGPELVGSFLTVDNIRVYERLGEIRVSFDSPLKLAKARNTKINRHSARLLDVSDTMIPGQEPVRAFSILARIVIGDCMFTADVWLTGKRFGSNRFVVGSNVLGSRYEVNPAKLFQLGQPVHRFMNQMQQETQLNKGGCG